MLAFPGMIEGAAREAGMKVPDNIEEYDAREYPHWHVFCILQLGAPLPYPSAHWDNAKVIAAVPEDEIFTMTYQQFVDKGVEIGYTLA